MKPRKCILYPQGLLSSLEIIDRCWCFFSQTGYRFSDAPTSAICFAFIWGPHLGCGFAHGSEAGKRKVDTLEKSGNVQAQKYVYETEVWAIDLVYGVPRGPASGHGVDCGCWIDGVWKVLAYVGLLCVFLAGDAADWQSLPLHPPPALAAACQHSCCKRFSPNMYKCQNSNNNNNGT